MRKHNLYQQAQDLLPQLSAWRRDLHAHPELGFEEVRTAAQVAAALEEMGIAVETGVGVTGVVGRLGSGHPAIGLRGDMDALPLQEANDVPYCSQNANVMHACGHDGNTTIVLGAAKLLSTMPDRPAGEIRFLFQPCEENQDAEGKSGAQRMIEDGALEGLDAIVGQHVDSLTPVGRVQLASGYAMASADSFEATIIGSGAHGAMPHTGVDPIYILSHVIQAIHAVVARRIDPIRPAVISIGSVHSGLAGNIIPERVTLNGTIRSFDPNVRQQLLDELEKAFGVARALGGNYELRTQGGYPATFNHASVADVIAASARDVVGPDCVEVMEPTMGAEDFSLMSQQAPAAMFMTGVEIEGDTRQHHNETFDMDERGLAVGAAVMAEASCRLLQSLAK